MNTMPRWTSILSALVVVGVIFWIIGTVLTYHVLSNFGYAYVYFFVFGKTLGIFTSLTVRWRPFQLAMCQPTPSFLMRNEDRLISELRVRTNYFALLLVNFVDVFVCTLDPNVSLGSWDIGNGFGFVLVSIVVSFFVTNGLLSFEFLRRCRFSEREVTIVVQDTYKNS